MTLARRATFAIACLAVCLLVSACKRRPDPPAQLPPTPQQLADRLRPSIEALVREDKLKQAIELAFVQIEDDTARGPLIEEILAAALAREVAIAAEIEEMLARGDHLSARTRLDAARAMLPARTEGPRFAALDKRIARLAAEEDDAQWSHAHEPRVESATIEPYGKQHWRQLLEQVKRWSVAPEDRTAVAGVAACAPPPEILRAAITACAAAGPMPPAVPAVMRRSVRVTKRELFGRPDAQGELTLEYAFALPRWEVPARLPLLLSLYPAEAMDLAHVEEGLAQSFELMATTGPMVFAGALAPSGLAWTDHPVGSVLARAIAQDLGAVAPIDPRRRYLDGPGNGGAGAWLVALSDPAPWAGVAPLGAPFEPGWIALLPNLRGLSVHVSHRADDPAVPMAGARSAVEALRAGGHGKVAVRPLKADPQDQEMAAREMISYMLAAPRGPPESAFTLAFVGPGTTAADCVRAVQHAPDRELDRRERMTVQGAVVDHRFVVPTSLGITFRENVIEVVSDGVSSFELLVPASRFDANRPIEVMQQRRRIARLRLAPTVEQVLALSRAYPDTEYVAAIPIVCHVASWAERYVERGFDPQLVKEFGREKFEALVADLAVILGGPELDRAAIARVVAAAPSEPVLEAALELANRPRLVEPGSHQLRIDLPSHPLPCYLFVPASKPGQKVPLLIDLHGGGGGGGGEHLAQMVENFKGLSAQHGPLAAALPHSATPLGWGPAAPGLEQVSRVVRELSRQIPIDPDRIYLSGFSMGAFGAWTSALVDPTPFAAILPTAGRIHPFMLPLMSNLDHVGIYVEHRIGDTVVPVGGARQARAALEALQHPNLVYREYPGEEHGGGPPEEQPARMKWLFAQRRITHPPRMRIKVMAPRPTRFRDVLARDFDNERPVEHVNLRGPANDPLAEVWFKEPAAIEVAFPKGTNAVEISNVDGVHEIELLLSVAVFDFAKPVVVRAGERVLYEGVVEATLATRLELARRFPEADYRASIVVRTR